MGCWSAIQNKSPAGNLQTGASLQSAKLATFVATETQLQQLVIGRWFYHADSHATFVVTESEGKLIFQQDRYIGELVKENDGWVAELILSEGMRTDETGIRIRLDMVNANACTIDMLQPDPIRARIEATRQVPNVANVYAYCNLFLALPLEVRAEAVEEPRWKLMSNKERFELALRREEQLGYNVDLYSQPSPRANRLNNMLIRQAFI